MKFLFETIVIGNNQMIFYRVYEMKPGFYFAELKQPTEKQSDFHLRRDDALRWLAEDMTKQNQAEQIGEEVDNYFINRGR